MKEMFEYNKLAYEKMRRDLDERKRACVIHCTGLGKTVIVLRYILDELYEKYLALKHLIV